MRASIFGYYTTREAACEVARQLLVSNQAQHTQVSFQRLGDGFAWCVECYGYKPIERQRDYETDAR